MSASTIKLPGWGSACSSPVSSIIVRYAFMATPQSAETRFRAVSSSAPTSASRRWPSTHRVASTRRDDAASTGFGAKTASAKGVVAIESMKLRAFFASRR